MNKNLPALLICLSFIGIANAQFTKGNLILAGTLSYISNSSTSSGNEQTAHGGNFSLLPGKAISENSVVGLNLGYGFNNSNYSGGQGGSKSDNYTIGVYYRKYKPLGGDFYLFGSANAGYIYSTSSTLDNAGNPYSSSNSNIGFLSFYPGIDFKVSKKILLELSIPSLFSASYNSSKSTGNGQDSKSTTFGISTSLTSNPLSSLGIGFVLVL